MADDWETLKQQVKEANDIVDVVGSYVSLRPFGPTFKGLCPFHDDRRPSLDVDPRRQRYRCWSCGKRGDVISFIQEHTHVDFREALQILAQRAGISLKKIPGSQQNSGRARMLELMKWAAEEYHRCLMDSPQAEAAGAYVSERHLNQDTVRRFLLGYAPPSWDWLVQRAARAGKPSDLLEQVGLIAPRREGSGYYDRFRDRLMFPIRDAAGHTVGFGGRVLPSAESSNSGPKYYNSSATSLFDKSKQLYGIDQARQAGAKAGYLAVVEGYTDVLMAHQAGVCEVVATMGTALNATHVQHLRRFVPRIVLVFDADAGGSTGVDRALEIFASEEVDLAIAELPAGMDPCDLLVHEGPDPFRRILATAVDALEFKLEQVLASEGSDGVEARRRAVDSVLGVIALSPDLPGPAGAVKRDLMVNRIAHRLGVREELVRSRLGELRSRKRASPAAAAQEPTPERRAPALPREQELMQVLLAEPSMVSIAASEVSPEEIEHPGIKRLLQGLYALHANGELPDLERLRPEIENPALYQTALLWQERGLQVADRAAWLDLVLADFRKRRILPRKQELQNQLEAARDHTEAVDLLRRLQQQTVSWESGSPPSGARTPERGGF